MPSPERPCCDVETRTYRRRTERLGASLRRAVAHGIPHQPHACSHGRALKPLASAAAPLNAANTMTDKLLLLRKPN
jgi:hypothetical protein